MRSAINKGQGPRRAGTGRYLSQLKAAIKKESFDTLFNLLWEPGHLTLGLFGPDS